MTRRAAILCMTLLAASLPACEETRTTPEESAAILEALTETVPPEGYRSEVVVLEYVLFATGELSSKERDLLAIALGDLADKLAIRQEAAMASIIAGEIRILAMGLGPDGRWTRAAGRLHWMRIRNHIFGDAPWFRYKADRPAASA